MENAFQERAAERRKRASDARWSRIFKRRDGLRREIIRLFERARKEHLSQKALLDHRTKYILDSQAYKAGPNWLRNYWDGVWDTCMDQLMNELVHTYVHGGVRRDGHELANAGLASEIDTSTAAFAYRNEDGTFTDIFL